MGHLAGDLAGLMVGLVALREKKGGRVVMVLLFQSHGTPGWSPGWSHCGSGGLGEQKGGRVLMVLLVSVTLDTWLEPWLVSWWVW